MSLPPLFLNVTNPEQLTHGSSPSYSLQAQSMTIGSGTVDWKLYDAFGSVKGQHACIQVLDGKYVMIDLCGKTYINRHADPLGRMEVVAINDGDQIRIGKYRVEVMIDEDGYAKSIGVDHIRKLDLGQLFTKENELDRLTRSLDYKQLGGEKNEETSNPLNDLLEKPKTANALSVLLKGQEDEDTIARRHPVLADTHEVLSTSLASVADVGNSMQEAISLPSYEHLRPSEKKVTQTMDIQTGAHVQQAVDNTIDAKTSISDSEFQASHLTNAPLTAAMELASEPMEPTQAHQFSGDVGLAVKAAIEGLLALYQAEQNGPANISLLGRSYHPIEDNPLRMGMDYGETSQRLFSTKRSAVYLSPEAAIAESMASIKNNQAAIVTAIQQGLWQVLEALSPQNLEGRFASYRKADGESVDAWEMYKKYFEELMSSRQSGLEKMFWEVFEQNYDRAMRGNSERVSS